MPKVNDLKQFILMERQQRNNLAAFNLLAKKEDAVSQLRDYLNTGDKRNNILHINDVKYGQPTESDLKTMTSRLKVLQTDFNDLSIPKPFENSSEEMDAELKFVRMLRKLSEDPDTVRDIDDEDEDLISPFMRFARSRNLSVDETFIRLLIDDVNTLALRFKYMFNRPRPKQLAAQKGLELIAHKGDSAHSPSYPSAHSAAGRVVGKALGDKYSDYADEFEKIGASIGLHRLIAGLHYPTDHAAGIMLGDQIYQKGLVKDHTNFMMPESEDLVRAVQQAITKHAEGFNLNKSIDDMGVLVAIFKALDRPHVFVTGTNLLGVGVGSKGAGTNEAAGKIHFAEEGLVRGFSGHSYGVPTTTAPVNKKHGGKALPHQAPEGTESIESGIRQLVRDMAEHPEFVWHIPDIATGRAGQEPEDIGHLFSDAVMNLPEELRDNVIGRMNDGNDIMFGPELAPHIKWNSSNPALPNWRAPAHDPEKFNYYPHENGGQVLFGDDAEYRPTTTQAESSSPFDTTQAGDDPEEENPFYDQSGRTKKSRDSVPYDPRAVTVHSGGAEGSDSQWAYHTEHTVAGRTLAWSWDGHRVHGGTTSIIPNIGNDKEALEMITNANKSLGRSIPEPSYRRNLLLRNWYQIRDSHAVIAMVEGFDIDKNTVRGGTGWAVQMGVDEGLPVHIFNEETNKWYTWNDDAEKEAWDEVSIDEIPFYQNFAGVGTRGEIQTGGGRKLKDSSVAAIKDYCTKLAAFQKTDVPFTPLSEVATFKRANRIPTNKKLASAATTQAENAAEAKAARKKLQEDPKNIYSGSKGHQQSEFFKALGNSGQRAIKIYGKTYANAGEAFEMLGIRKNYDKDRAYSRPYTGYAGATVPEISERGGGASATAESLGKRHGEGSFPITGTQTHSQQMMNEYDLMVRIITAKLEQHDDLVDSLQAAASSQVDKEGQAAPMEVADYIKSLKHQTGETNDTNSWVGDGEKSNFVRALHDAYVNITNKDIEIPEQIQEVSFDDDDPEERTPKVKDLIEGITIRQSTWDTMSDAAKMQVLINTKHLGVDTRFLDIDRSISALQYPSLRALRKEAEYGEMTGETEEGIRIVGSNTKPFETSDPFTGAASFADRVEGLIPRVASTVAESSTKPTHILRVTWDGYKDLIGIGSPYEQGNRLSAGAWSRIMDLENAQLYRVYEAGSQDPDTEGRVREFEGEEYGAKLTQDDIRTGKFGTAESFLVKVLKAPNDAIIQEALGIAGGRVPEFEGQEPGEESIAARPMNAYYLEEYARLHGDSEDGNINTRVAYLSDLTLESNDADPNTLRVQGRIARTPFDKMWGTKEGKFRDGILTQLVELAERMDKYGTSTLTEMFDDVLNSIEGALNQRPSTKVLSELRDVIGDFHSFVYPTEDTRGAERLSTGSRKDSSEVLEVAETIREHTRTKEWAEYENTLVDENEASAAEIEDNFRDQFAYELDRMHPNQRKNFDATSTGEKGERKLIEHFLRLSLQGNYAPPRYDQHNNVTLEGKVKGFDSIAPWLKERVDLLEKEVREKFNSVDEFPDNKRPELPEKPEMGVEDAEDLEPKQLEELKQQWADYEEYEAKLERWKNPTRVKVGRAVFNMQDTLLNTKYWGEANDNKNVDIWTDLFGSRLPSSKAGEVLPGASYARYAKVWNKIKSGTYFRPKKAKPSANPTHGDLQTFLKILRLGRGGAMFPSEAESSMDAATKAGVSTAALDGLIGEDANRLNSRTRQWINLPENNYLKGALKYNGGLAASFKAMVKERTDALRKRVNPTEIEDENGNLTQRVRDDINDEVLAKMQGNIGKIIQKFDPDFEGTVKDWKEKLKSSIRNFVIQPSGKTSSEDFSGEKILQEYKADFIPNTPRPSHLRQEYLAWHRDTVLQKTALKVTGKATFTKTKGFGELSEAEQKFLTDAYYQEIADGRRDIPLLNSAEFDKFYRSRHGKSPRQATREWDDWDNNISRATYSKTDKTEEAEIVEERPEATGIAGFDGELVDLPDTARMRKRDTDYDAQMNALYKEILPKATPSQRDQIEAGFGVKGGLDDQYFGTTRNQNSIVNSSDKERLDGYFRGVRQVLQQVANGQIVLLNETLTMDAPDFGRFAKKVVDEEVANVIDTQNEPIKPELISRADYEDMSDSDFDNLLANATDEYNEYHTALPDPIPEPVAYVAPVGKKGHKNIGADAGIDQEASIIGGSEHRAALRGANFPLRGQEEGASSWLPDTTQARRSSDIIDGKPDDEDVPRPVVKWGDGMQPRYTFLSPEEQQDIMNKQADRARQWKEDVAEYEARRDKESEAVASVAKVDSSWTTPKPEQKVFTGAGAARHKILRGGEEEEQEAPAGVETVNVVAEGQDKEPTDQKADDLDARIKEYQAKTPSPSPEEAGMAEDQAAEWAGRAQRPVKGTDDAV